MNLMAAKQGIVLRKKLNDLMLLLEKKGIILDVELKA